jgi:hypothetical protein
MKENVGALLDARKEFGPEENAEKTVYVHVSSPEYRTKS